MFMTLNTKQLKDQYAAYTLTDLSGKVLFVGVSKLSNILALPYAPEKLPENVNIIISEPKDDLMKAANTALYIAQNANRVDLVEGLTRLMNAIQRPPRRNGRPVFCVETGERFFSVYAAAKAHKLTYSAILNHLKRLPGFKTVKGRTYTHEFNDIREGVAQHERIGI